MIVSKELFIEMQHEMLDVALAIKERRFSNPAELEEIAVRAVGLSCLMAEAEMNGSDDREEDVVETNVEWKVYGVHKDEKKADLCAAGALRCHSDRLLEKWGRSPSDEAFVSFAGKGSEGMKKNRRNGKGAK